MRRGINKVENSKYPHLEENPRFFELLCWSQMMASLFTASSVAVWRKESERMEQGEIEHTSWS